MSKEESAKPFKFGNDIKDNEFCLRDGFSFLNHGSYGVVPKRIKELQKQFVDY